MSTLFTFNKSWHQAPWLYERLGFASDNDAILLLEDAVLALQSPLSLASFLGKCGARSIRLFALQSDIQARAIENCYEEIQIINHDEFVKLVVEYDKQVAWEK